MQQHIAEFQTLLLQCNENIKEFKFIYKRVTSFLLRNSIFGGFGCLYRQFENRCKEQEHCCFLFNNLTITIINNNLSIGNRLPNYYFLTRKLGGCFPSRESQTEAIPKSDFLGILQLLLYPLGAYRHYLLHPPPLNRTTSRRRFRLCLWFGMFSWSSSFLYRLFRSR